MASLTGQSIANTYDSLLKLTDNEPLTSSLKVVTDGLGNSSVLQLSTLAATLTGALSGTSATFSGNVTSGNATNAENLFVANGSSFSGLRLQRNSVNKWAIFNNNAGTDFFDIYNYGTSSSALSITFGNNVLIGTTTDAGYKLDVNGTGRFSGALSGTSATFSSRLNINGAVDNANYAINVANSGYSFFGGSASGLTPSSIGLSIGYNRSGANGETTLVYGAPAAGFNFEIASVTSGVITPRLTITNTGAATFSGTSNSIIDILTLNNTSVTSAGVRQLFNNGYGNLAAIRSYQADNGGGADDGVLEFQTATNSTLSTKLTITETGVATFSGTITTAAPSGGTARPFKVGAAASVSPTSPNRTIEIEIDGTTYYLSAKTTND